MTLILVWLWTASWEACKIKNGFSYATFICKVWAKLNPSSSLTKVFRISRTSQIYFFRLKCRAKTTFQIQVNSGTWTSRSVRRPKPNRRANQTRNSRWRKNSSLTMKQTSTAASSPVRAAEEEPRTSNGVTTTSARWWWTKPKPSTPRSTVRTKSSSRFGKSLNKLTPRIVPKLFYLANWRKLKSANRTHFASNKAKITDSKMSFPSTPTTRITTSFQTNNRTFPLILN